MGRAYEKACVRAILLRCQELAARLRVLRTAVRQRSTGPAASDAASPFSAGASSASGDHESNVADLSPLPSPTLAITPNEILDIYICIYIYILID